MRENRTNKLRLYFKMGNMELPRDHNFSRLFRSPFAVATWRRAASRLPSAREIFCFSSLMIFIFGASKKRAVLSLVCCTRQNEGINGIKQTQCSGVLGLVNYSIFSVWW